MSYSPDPSGILEGLNDVQLAGVTHGDGPLLILAGAGSGKTRVLTRRLAYLVASRDVEPERILAVTFTNKAAGEMRERVDRLLGKTARSMWIGTFHSICLRILKRHAARLGFRGPVTVFDADDQASVIRETLKEADLGEASPRPRDVLAAISFAKNRMLTPEEYAEGPGKPIRHRIARIWRSYEARLREQDGVDFDDILLLALRLLTEVGEIGEAYATRFLHILVDEYQDTNRVQFHLVRRLASLHGNICVVGDDDQSIYRWRGADVTNILDFERHFPSARVLRLEQNYRSTAAILEVANSVIRHNASRKEKSLWTTREGGEPVGMEIAEDEEQEARSVARAIREGLRAGMQPSGFAVLYRTHAQSRPLEDALIRGEIPYRVLGGVSFYQRREVKDLLAYLRILVNPRDEVSFRRLLMAPRRGAGETTIDRVIEEGRARSLDLLSAAAAAPGWGIPGRGLAALAETARWLMELALRVSEPPHTLLEEIVRHVDYSSWLRTQGEAEWEDRFAHVVELIEGAERYEGSEEGATLAGFLEQVALYAQTDSIDSGGDRVTLMTVHNAKGLEYDAVFVTGLEEGLFPHISSLDDPEELEEERRLFYVAATRARSLLRLSASRQRRRINFTGMSEVSRFVTEIPESLLAIVDHGRPVRAQGLRSVRETEPDWEDAEQDWGEAAIEREPALTRRNGLVARHVRYGTGRVLAIEGEGDRARVEVDFPGWGRKKILRAYLTIEREGRP